MQLKDRVAIITGAGGGIGRAAAIKLAQQGAKLVLVDLNMTSLSNTLALLKQDNYQTEVIAITADVSKEEEVQNYVSQCVNQYGRIDAFFNNAGIEGPSSLISDYDFSQFTKVISVNLFGVFLGLKYVADIMKNQKSGSIVNTSSIGGVGALPNFSPYVASKHAVIGLTRNAAIEYGKMGIRINAVCPGFINTDMIKNVASKQSPDNPQKYYDDLAAAIPVGRLGEPGEVANLVSFLLSDESSYINGAAIAIDGAFTAQ